MKKIKRLVAVVLAILMIFGSVSTAAFAEDTALGENQLKIETKIFRLVKDNWVQTDKVIAGEKVMARVYVGTGYYTGPGSMLFFYNTNMLSGDFGTGSNTLDVNPYYQSSKYKVTGEFVATGNIENQMLGYGKITPDFASKNDFVNVGYKLGAGVSNVKFDQNQWLFQIPLTVKADAPASTEGIFQAIPETAQSPDFSAGRINVPKGVEGGFYTENDDMRLWYADLDFSYSAVTLFTNPVNITFNPNGGKFSDIATDATDKNKYLVVEANEEITDFASYEIKEPVKNGFNFEGWKVSGADDSTAVKTLSAWPAADTTYEAVWKSNSGSDEILTFRTEIHRLNPETGEWEFTTKVKPGEAVKARIFVDTSYYTNAGEIVVFYEKDFFMDSYTAGAISPATFNDSATSSAAINGTYGKFSKVLSTNDKVQRLVDNGYITKDYADKHQALLLNYRFDPSTGKKISGEEWFAEFDLVVNPSARGEGEFMFVEDTIMSTSRKLAYINIPYSEEGAADTTAKAMFLWDVNPVIENNPVYTYSSITFKPNGGTFASGVITNEAGDSVYEADIGTTVAETVTPEISKVGAIFLGWADEEGNIVEVPEEMPYEDLVLTASWLNNIEVTFVLDNGEANIVKQASPGAAFEAVEDPVKEGYRFRGWSVNESGDPIEALPGVYPDDSTTYYAIWDKKDDITFVLNNGEENIVQSVVAGDAVVAPADPVKEGNTFIGWSTDSTGKTVTGLPDVYPAGATYYAIYNPKTYSVNYFIANPDTGKFVKEDTGYVTFGEPITAKPLGYEVPEGYTLSPAYTDATLTTVLPADEIMPAETVALYFELIPGKYIATFVDDINEDGSENIYEEVETVFGKYIQAPADPVKEGYIFKGWDTDVAIMDTEGKKFYATWEKAQYKATYIVNGATYEAYDVPYGEEVDVPADPYVEGYTFKGWTPDIPATMPAEDKEFVAVFEVNAYDVTFDTTTGAWDDGSTTKTESTEFGAEINVPADPTMQGYVFTGWTPAIPDSMPDEAQSFEATWAPAENTPYTVKTYTMGTDGKYGAAVEEKRIGTTGETATAVTNATDGFKVAENSTLSKEIAADGSTVLEIYYERESYTVTFDANEGVLADGKETADSTYYYGATVVAPANPTREGYTFVEWKPLVFGTVTTNVTYVAQWEANEYTITFVDTGDVAYAPITQDYDTDIAAVADPVKTGYTFTGWINDEGQAATVPAKMPVDGMTLTATWSINEYTITFENTGDTTIEPIKQDYNTAVTAPAEPTKTGYTWAGWDTLIPENMPAKDMTITGQWTINQYTITFAETGDTTIEPIKQDYNTAVTAPADPVKFGYTFDGWDVAIPETMPAGNVTITAKWKINSYVAEFYKESEDTEVYRTTTVVYNEKINPTVSPSKTGYDFAGWSADPDATVPDESLGIMDTEGKKFYAVWTPIPVNYTVKHYFMTTDLAYPEEPDRTDTLSKNTGTLAVAAPDVDKEKTFTVDTEKSILEAVVAADGTTVLEVYYARNVYTLSLDVDGVITDEEHPYEATVTLGKPEKAGYDFTGWKKDESTVLQAGETFAMPGNDLTLTATWKVHAHNVTYIVDDETYFGPTSTNYGEAIAEPSVPTKVGYVFAGWTDEDGKKPSDYVGMPDKELVFTANWTPNANIGYVLEVYEMGTDGKYTETATTVYTFNDGVVGDERTVTPTVPAGFTLDKTMSELTGTIPAAGTLTLKAYFERNKHTLTITIDGVNDEKEYYYGQAVPDVADPVKEGSTFTGWTVAIPDVMPDNDVATEATWSTNSYNLTWDVDGTTDTKEVLYGAAIEQPEDPTKEGYKFAGWSPAVPETMPAEDKTFVATWTANAHVATFNANGGKWSENEFTKNVPTNYGEAIAVPAAPAMEGYVFAGWDATIPATMPDENLTFNAKWDPAENTPYTVEIYTMGTDGKYGAAVVENRTGTTGETATAATNATDGFTVAAESVLSAEIAADGSTVLKVYYARDSFTVTFDANEGVLADGKETSDATYYYGATVVAPANPTREGYTFVEWKPLVFGTVTTNVTYVAQWEANEYTITFVDTGDVAYAPITQDYDTDIAAVADPVKTGYTFTGWINDEGQAATVPAKMPVDGMTLTATWSINEYTITFENTGDTEIAPIKQDYNTAVTAPADPTKVGYTWAGWDATVPSTMPAENLTITGSWTVNQYTLTFGDTGDTTIEPIKQDYGTAVTAPEAPTKEGYTFDGWDAEIPATMPAENQTINATWKINQYTITFENTGDTEIAPIKQDYNTAVTAPAQPTKEGYTWKGWDVAVPDTMPAEDITITGNWDINQYTITFGNTGDTTIEPITQDYGTAVTAPADPTRTGYTFAGWSDTVPANMPAKDTKLNAKWTANTYSAKFFENADDELPFDETEAKFTEFIIPSANVPVKAGYEFLGWSTDPEATEAMVDLGTMDTEGKIFYAVWNEIEVDYTVEHYYMTTDLTYADTADRADTDTALTNSNVTATPDVTENFTLDEEKSVLTGTVAGDGSTVLKVYYIREVNTLRVNIDGKVTDKEYPFDAPVDTITEPTKDGYQFAGWVDDNGAPVEAPEKMPGDDVTLNATWKAQSYTVTYKVDGEIYGTPASVDFGAPIGEAAYPTKAGYTFEGWYDADGKKPADYGVMPDNDLTFEAKWNANTGVTYIVEIYVMDIEETYPAIPNEKNVYTDGVVGEVVSTTPEVRKGFTVDTVKSVLSDTVEATETVVLTVYYERNKHSLTVNVENSEPVVTEYFYDEAVVAPADPIKEGYSFTGWVDAENNAVQIPATMPDNDVTVYATFEIKTLDAIFDAGDGIFESDGENTEKVPVVFGEEIVAPAEKPVKAGYEFVGWSADPEAETPDASFGTMGSESVTFYPVWSKSTFKLTYYVYTEPTTGPNIPTEEGRVELRAAEDKDFGEVIALPDGPDFKHHIFLGWSTKEFDENYIVAEGYTMPAGDLALYAVYERVQVMLIPAVDGVDSKGKAWSESNPCTTFIDRNGGTVDDYVPGESKWYVSGLQEMMEVDVLLDNYIDVQGDGRIELEFLAHQSTNYPGSGTTIKVYDNVTGELVESFTIIIYGDLNGDTYITTIDASIITNESLGNTHWSKESLYPEDYVEYMFIAGDINEDKYIAAVDSKIVDDHVFSSVIDQTMGAK